MEDGGAKLRELVEIERDLSRWNDVLPLYAGVQIDLDGQTSTSCSPSGVPDFRLASLPAKLEALLDEIDDAASTRNGAGSGPHALGS